VERVGIKYRNFIDMITFDQTSIVTNPGKDIHVCPYTGEDVQSTMCLKDAVKKLQKKVNYGIKWNEPEYIELHSNYTAGAFRHEQKFDFMCELKQAGTCIGCEVTVNC
jgi:hypothetical protein